MRANSQSKNICIVIDGNSLKGYQGGSPYSFKCHEAVRGCKTVVRKEADERIRRKVVSITGSLRNMTACPYRYITVHI